MKKIVILVLVLSAVPFVWGCGRKAAEENAPPKETQPAVKVFGAPKIAVTPVAAPKEVEVKPAPPVQIKVAPEVMALGPKATGIRRFQEAGETFEAGLSLTLSFAKDFKGELRLKAYDARDKELGKGVAKLESERGVATEVEFRFGEQTSFNDAKYFILDMNKEDEAPPAAPKPEAAAVQKDNAETPDHAAPQEPDQK